MHILLSSIHTQKFKKWINHMVGIVMHSSLFHILIMPSRFGGLPVFMRFFFDFFPIFLHIYNVSTVFLYSEGYFVSIDFCEFWIWCFYGVKIIIVHSILSVRQYESIPTRSTSLLVLHVWRKKWSERDQMWQTRRLEKMWCGENLNYLPSKKHIRSRK